jgi:hypothetical protein
MIEEKEKEKEKEPFHKTDIITWHHAQCWANSSLREAVSE